METALPEHSMRLRRAPAGAQDIVGAYGGHPRGVRAAEWPRCEVCGAPMCHMGQFDASQHLELNGYRRMSLFICHATGGRCEDWKPWKGANKVLLHEHHDDHLYDGPPTVRVYRRVELVGDPPYDESEVWRAAGGFGLMQPDVTRAITYDKIGGGPVWIQGQDVPVHPDTGNKMQLLLQLTTEIVLFDITMGGMAYVFVDPTVKGDNAMCLSWQGG